MAGDRWFGAAPPHPERLSVALTGAEEAALRRALAGAGSLAAQARALADALGGDGDAAGCAFALLARGDPASVALAARLLPIDGLEPSGLRCPPPLHNPADHQRGAGPAGLEAALAPDDARLSLALAAAARAAGEPLGPWRALALAAGPLVALLEDLGRCWLDREQAALVQGRWGPALAIWIEADASGALAALAGDRSSPDRRAELTAGLGGPAAQSALQARAEAWLTAAWAACPPAGLGLLEALEDGLKRARAAAFAAAVLASAAEPPPWSPEAIPGAVAHAAARARRDPGYPGSIDHQRFGVDQVAAALVADWFPRAQIALDLARAGLGDEGELAGLLAEAPAEGLRYYRGWRCIPPDADSLGAALQVAARVAAPPEETLRGWLALLDLNLGGGPTVWLYQGPSGPTSDEVLRWTGGDCIASLLSLALGLALLGQRPGVVSAVAALALGRLSEGRVGGAVFYPQSACDRLFVRLARALPAHEGLAAGAAAVAAAYLVEQRLDGGWGSPVETARALEIVWGHAERLTLLRGARYLVETQRGDGGWEVGEAWKTAGRPGYVVPFGGPELTAAECGAALAGVWGRLSEVRR